MHSGALTGEEFLFSVIVVSFTLVNRNVFWLVYRLNHLFLQC